MHLADTLEHLGFKKIEDSVDTPMIDRVIIYAFEPIKIRFWDEHGKWFVDLSEAHMPSLPYHTGLLKCAIGESSDGDEIEISEEAEFWNNHLGKVLAFFNEGAEQSHKKLQEIALAISKRKHPGRYGL